jgi:glutamate/tyrosine decarboxylase-like PLP-dependent enzyme
MAKETIKLNDLIPQVVHDIEELRASFGDFQTHSSQQADLQQVKGVLTELVDRLQADHPYFHPNYAAQMLKPPHAVAVAAYLATMILNPNNHSQDASRATTPMEREVLRELTAMFEFPEESLGHLTWSGTTANLEALWVGREVNPGKAIAHSADAHYTHSRMAEVLDVDSIAISVDALGRMSLTDLEEKLKTGKIGTVVATLGTTGLGAVDPLADIITLARRYEARVHVDTAYGGFFKLIQDDLAPEAARHYAAIKDADSVVVDPHKHGLQPYGCGAVLFKDVSVGRFYKHDSPYTYFTSAELHFGEIQLETSRAGASAAAFWATTRVFPLTKDGLGSILAAGHRAAQNWWQLLSDSEILQPYQKPELDIIAYLPRANSMSEIDRLSQAIFMQAEQAPRPEQIHLATYMVKPNALFAHGINVETDMAKARILRSTLMKPEHENWVPTLHTHIEDSARKLMNK